jgi:hypothetical protein
MGRLYKLIFLLLFAPLSTFRFAHDSRCAGTRLRRAGIFRSLKRRSLRSHPGIFRVRFEANGAAYAKPPKKFLN